MASPGRQRSPLRRSRSPEYRDKHARSRDRDGPRENGRRDRSRSRERSRSRDRGRPDDRDRRRDDRWGQERSPGPRDRRPRSPAARDDRERSSGGAGGSGRGGERDRGGGRDWDPRDRDRGGNGGAGGSGRLPSPPPRDRDPRMHPDRDPRVHPDRDPTRRPPSPEPRRGGYGGGYGGGGGGRGYGGGGGGGGWGAPRLPAAWRSRMQYEGFNMDGPRADQMPRDEDIHGADSFQELRRLKRLQMWEDGGWTLWRNTPSPPPGQGPTDSSDSDDEAAAAANGQQQQAAAANGKGGDMPPPPPRAPRGHHAAEEAAKEARRQKELEKHQKELDALEEQEVELFQAWYADVEASREAAEAAMRAQAEEDALVGPALPGSHKPVGGAAGNYGGFLLPGEGDRMAQYVASGKRIPRRGEVGLSSDQIEHYETLGYIMSGSRHSRMNAIRIRKENQIYSAEEKAALAMYNFEENKSKEAKILEDMRRLVDRTMGTGAAPGGGGGGGGEFEAGGTEGGGAE